MKLKKTEFLSRLERIGESRSDFARRCGISRQAITAWINGERNPKPGNVKTMANALRCRIEDIAEPQTKLETVAAHGDKFARDLLGISDDPVSPVEAKSDNDLEPMTLKFIADRLAEEIRQTNQSEVGRKIGLSASQINRLAHRKSDLSSLPVSALSRLCPEIINRDVLGILTESPAGNVRPPTREGLFVPIITSAAAASCNPGMMPLLDCVNQYSEDTAYFKQAKPGDFVIEVNGSSMSPWYPDGTLLLVRPYQDLRNGQRVVAVLDDGEIIFKIYAEKDNKLCLFSINGDGKDYIFTKPRIPIRYICRVIASQRDEDDLDEEMKHQHIVHSWQTKLNGIAAK